MKEKKRVMLKKLWLIIVLIVHSLIFETQSAETFGSFKGFHWPFISSDGSENNLAYLSPIHGVDDTIASHLRLHGNYGPENKGHPRPVYAQRDQYTFPQDYAASLLEILFPSHMGFLINSLPGNPIHDLLKPAQIALLFNEIQTFTFEDDQYYTELMKISLSLQPGAKKNYEQHLKFNSRQKKTTTEDALETQHRVAHDWAKKNMKKCLDKMSTIDHDMSFAELIYHAFRETRGRKAIHLGYPVNVVERILLTYMWHKKKDKKDLKPFYENLKGIDQSLIKIIPWEGESSGYTEEDYFRIKKEKSSNEENAETNLLLRKGYTYFEDLVPSGVPYGVSYVKLNRTEKGFSDCGESQLLSLFMMFLYDFKTKKFKLNHLDFLKTWGFCVNEHLIHFFKVIYPSPLRTYTQTIRNAWASVLSNLNTSHSDGEKICYLEPKGEKEQTFCIAPGIGNMAKVIDKLFWSPYSRPNSQNLGEFFDQLCRFFSPWNEIAAISYNWGWKKNTRHSSDHDIDPESPVSITFFLEDEIEIREMFELHFMDNHFDFNRFEESKTDVSMMNSDYLSLVGRLSKPIPEEKFADKIYKENLNSIPGKLRAIGHILNYQKFYHSNAFHLLLARWIEPTGVHFADWGDYFTNSKLFRIFQSVGNFKTEDFFDLNIPQLISHLTEDLSNLCYKSVGNGDIEMIRKIFYHDQQAYEAEKKTPLKFEPRWREWRVLYEVLHNSRFYSTHTYETLEAAGAEEYCQQVFNKSFTTVVFGDDLMNGIKQTPLGGDLRRHSELTSYINYYSY